MNAGVLQFKGNNDHQTIGTKNMLAPKNVMTRISIAAKRICPYVRMLVSSLYKFD